MDWKLEEDVGIEDIKVVGWGMIGLRKAGVRAHTRALVTPPLAEMT
jgi:hypothetical protein